MILKIGFNMKLKGTLHRDSTGEFFFRNYKKDGDFIDYIILADEMEITINDQFVSPRKLDNDDMAIDYTDETLGYEEDTEEEDETY